MALTTHATVLPAAQPLAVLGGADTSPMAAALRDALPPAPIRGTSTRGDSLRTGWLHPRPADWSPDEVPTVYELGLFDWPLYVLRQYWRVLRGH